MPIFNQTLANIEKMKLIINFSFLVLFLIFSKFSFTQNKDINPNSLIVDPYNYNFQKLGINQILEYKVYRKKGTPKENIYLSYVVNYDTLGRISTFKYDFQKQIDLETVIFQSTQIDISVTMDSSKFFQFKLKDTIEFFNYYEKLYLYNENELKSITISKPIRNIFDGVYIRENNVENVCKVNTVNKEGKVIKTENYHNNELFSTIEYEYTTFSKYDFSTTLLTKTTLTIKEEIIERCVKYSFE